VICIFSKSRILHPLLCLQKAVLNSAGIFSIFIKTCFKPKNKQRSSALKFPLSNVRLQRKNAGLAMRLNYVWPETASKNRIFLEGGEVWCLQVWDRVDESL